MTTYSLTKQAKENGRVGNARVRSDPSAQGVEREGHRSGDC